VSQEESTHANHCERHPGPLHAERAGGGPGRHAADAPAGAYTLDLLAEDARALLQVLDIRRVHFVGLSMGGMIGQMLGLKHSELLRSLVLCDTSSRVPAEARSMWDERIRMAEAQGMEPLVQSTIARWFTPTYVEKHPEVVEPVRAMIRRTPPQGFAGCGQAIKMLDLTDQLPRIGTPTLVIVGEDDPGTPVAASRTIHERIQGSELVILKSAAHLSNVEQPEAFAQALLGFLGRQA
jgi:3-oxoadipate enol-lactonase